MLKFEDVIQIKYSLDASEDQLVAVWKNKSNEWETVAYAELTEHELKKEWVCLRTKFQLNFAVENISNYRNELLQLLQSTKSKICETNKPVLKVAGTEISLKKDKVLVSIGKNAKINAALQQTKTDQSAAQTDQFETLNIVVGAGDDDTVIDDISSLFSSKQISQTTQALLKCGNWFKHVFLFNFKQMCR